MPWANALLQDGGSDLLRTRAGTADRIKMHVLKAYAPGDSFATAVSNSCGNVSLVAGDMVQSGAVGAARVTTFAGKNVSLTADSTQYDTGTATAGASTTMTDSGGGWTTNQHAGRAVVILSGTGAGQSRRIASNTSTVLTVTVAWSTNPDATSVYAIRDDTAIVILDHTSSEVLYQTDESGNQLLQNGNTFVCPSFTYSVAQPTAA